jgi:hypothetical protein
MVLGCAVGGSFVAGRGCCDAGDAGGCPEAKPSLCEGEPSALRGGGGQVCVRSSCIDEGQENQLSLVIMRGLVVIILISSVVAFDLELNDGRWTNGLAIWLDDELYKIGLK